MANQAELDCRLERMRWEDLDEVHRIEKECFSSPWPKNVFRSMLSDHSAFAYVARIERVVVGYVISWLDSDQVVIANLAVRQSDRRRQIYLIR